MNALEKIKEHVRRLSPDELNQFRAWFAAYDARTRDAQIEADPISGELDSLISEALAEHYVGTKVSAGDGEPEFTRSPKGETEPRLSVYVVDDAEMILAEEELEELARRHG